MKNKYLLITSCSKRKKNINSKIQAINRYDGTVFKIIKKMMSEKIFPEAVDILIVSAKYGLIKSTDKIEYYDELMNNNKIKVLKPNVMQSISKILKKTDYNEIFINLGKNYIRLLNGFEKFVNSNCKIIYAKGRIGQKLKQTRDWLLRLSNQKFSKDI